MTESKTRPTTVADYLTIVRRRKWVVVLPPIAAAVLAFLLSSSQTPQYEASAQILVDRTSVATAITKLEDPSLGDPTRYLKTQSSIARSPDLAARVARQLPGMTPAAVLGQTAVSPSADADLLSVSATDTRPAFAMQLANTFASELTRFIKERATATVDETLSLVETRLKSLAAHGRSDSLEYEELSQQRTQLVIIGRLLAGSTSVLRPADGAGKISPRPTRDLMLAGMFGLVLGIALAFLAEALDRHVRSEHELDDALGLPLLARVPKPPRRLRKANELVMLSAADTIHAETFRKLRTSVEFVNPDGTARTLMITSAMAQEGKSTTLANLGIAFARANRRVLLVDLDLRMPFLSRLFQVGGRPGITDVALKRATLAQAIRPITLPAFGAAAARMNGSGPPSASNGSGSAEGVLHLLPAGTIPPSADEMLQHPRLFGLLEELVGEFDIILVDAPPLLAFGDAMTISANVDGIIAVTRLGRVQRPILREFARQLQTCKARRLGYVVTGVEKSDSYRYMYEGYVYDARLREKTSSKERV
jgi:Mrp family chromosome partitioning ATPase